jgi:tetratricopeptide (TPR) repeat protein
MTTAVRSLLFLLTPVIVFADQGIASLHPLYTKETAVRNPALVGLWSQIRIEPDGETGYEVSTRGSEKAELKFHLVEIGGEMIADIVFERDSDLGGALPAHLIARVRVEGDTLRADLLGSEELANRIRQTGSPRYELLTKEELNDNNQDVLLLTASSAELRRFVLDCLKQPDAFTDPLTFTRSGPEQQADDLNDRSWAVVRGPANPDAYAKALQQAQEAVNLVGDNASYLRTLGAALYRAGRYSEALAALARAGQPGKTTSPAGLVFRAMAHQQLGETALAKAALGELRKMLDDSKTPGDSPSCGDQELPDLVREAENLIAPKAK